MEKWKPITVWKDGKFYDFTGYYEVSSEGRIRSVDRVVESSNGSKRFFKGMIRKPITDKEGYQLTSLWCGGKGGLFKIHRIVAEVFIPNPDYLPLINHKDENKANNKVSNLEWCDSLYNTNYGSCVEKRTKSWKNQWTEEQSQKMLKTRADRQTLFAPVEVEQIDPITGEVVAVFSSISKATKEYDNTHIWEAATGKRNTAAGYRWRIKDNTK